MAAKMLRYIPGTDQFETLDPEVDGLGQVNTATAERLRKERGYTLVGDDTFSVAKSDFDARRARVSAEAANRSAAPPPALVEPERMDGPVLSAAAVARAAALEGRPGVGPQTAAMRSDLKQAAVAAPLLRTDISSPDEVAELMALSAPGAPDAVGALGDSIGMRTATRPTGRPSLEFSGFRGDPAVVQRQSDGTSTPGGVNSQSSAPPGERSRSLTPGDAAIPVAAAGTGGSGASARIRFSPGGSSRGEKELEAANAKQMEAIGARTALEQQQAAAEQARLDVELEATRRRQMDEQERLAIRQKAVDDSEAGLKAMVADLSNPSGEVDPDRWWNSRSTGQKVAAFASAFLTGFAGRPSVIQQMIDSDIDAQKNNLDRAERNRTRAMEGQKGLVALARDRFGDEILAMNAARAAAAEYTLKVVERETAGFKGQAAEVKKQELTAAVMQDLAEKREAFRVRAAQLGLQQAELALNIQAAQAKMAGAQSGMAAEQGQAVPLATLTPEQKKRAVVLPGSQGRAVLALSEDAAKKAQDAVVTGGKILGLLSQAIDMRREYGSETLPTKAKGTMTTLGKQILIAINKAEGLGSADADTTAILNEMIGGDLTAYGRLLPKLEQLRNTYQRGLGEAFTAYTGQSFGGTPSVTSR